MCFTHQGSSTHSILLLSGKTIAFQKWSSKTYWFCIQIFWHRFSDISPTKVFACSQRVWLIAQWYKVLEVQTLKRLKVSWWGEEKNIHFCILTVSCNTLEYTWILQGGATCCRSLNSMINLKRIQWKDNSNCLTNKLVSRYIVIRTSGVIYG